MTEQDWIDLGRRAVACKGWRWMPGVLARYERDSWCRVTEADSLGLPPRVMPPNSRRAWPDLRDPATVGCLLALVREAWGGDFGTVYSKFSGPTQANALVAALEAAP